MQINTMMKSRTRIRTGRIICRDIDLTIGVVVAIGGSSFGIAGHSKTAIHAGLDILTADNLDDELIRGGPAK
eukprot:389442-Pyramimonas_sp.AAC.1